MATTEKIQKMKLNIGPGYLAYVMITPDRPAKKYGVEEVKGPEDTEYTASILLSGEKADSVIMQVDKILADNKDSKMKDDKKSVCYRLISDMEEEKIDSLQKTMPDDVNVRDHKIIVRAKTNVQFEGAGGSVTDTKVRVYDGNVKEFELGDKKIGNGSKGRLSVILAFYNRMGNWGVGCYLRAVQVINERWYEGSDFGDEDKEEGGFSSQEEKPFDSSTEEAVA